MSSILPSGATLEVVAPGVVEYLWLKEGPAGPSGVMQSVVPGTNIDVDNTDPANPVVSVEPLTSADISGLAAVATSGAYNDLSGKPTLGTAAAQDTTAFATAAQGTTADNTASGLSAHIGDTSDAHDASAISVVPAGTIAATDVQAALAELDTEKATTGSVTTVATDLSNHISDATDAHDASAISFVPTGTIAATDVQAAIAEVAAEAGGGGSGAPLAVVTRTATAASTYTTSSTTNADVDATNLAITFTVPASGNVMVFLSGCCLASSGGARLYWSLRESTTNVVGTTRTACETATGKVFVRMGIRLTGLTPSASVTYKWAWRSSTTSAATLFYGDSANEFTTTTTEPGPLVMEVYAS